MGEGIKAITYEQIRIENFELLHLEEFQIKQQINEHTLLQFTGIIEEAEEERILLYATAGSNVTVYYENNKKEKRYLFRGVVTEVTIEKYKEQKHLFVQAMSHTYWLDQYKKSRSFQNTAMTYTALMEEVIKNTQGATITWAQSAEKGTKEFILQYRETDWQFLKRMASRQYTGLIPVSNSEFPKVYYGVAKQKQAKELTVLTYSMKKEIRTYQIDSSNYMKGVGENDYVTYELKSYEIRQVGEAIQFHKVTFYIREATYQIQNGILMATYQVGTYNRLRQRFLYNEQISGISLNGKIAGVQRDQVKVQLTIDGTEGDASYFFPYSTIAASPDGSGWYCMPEVGDEVRIYFPDKEEKNCYAISSVSGYVPAANDTTDRMADPSVTYLRTPADQALILDENGIEINSSDGKALIRLTKNGLIEIYGQNAVTIHAADKICIIAEKDACISAKESLILETEAGKVEFTEDNLILEGKYIMEN